MFGGETGSTARGSSPRELYHAVFDALTQPCARNVYRVGRGSVVYDMVGRWIPSGIVGFILGLRRVHTEETDVSQAEDSFHVPTWAWEKVGRE